MDADNAVETNYAQNAGAYDQLLTLPLGKLEQQLFDLCIKDCDGMKVLDLGGGTGNRARDALKAGAREVDVVDISQDMMRLGQEYEKSIGRDSISWYHGDASKSLDHLNLGSYDTVIANGIFDHAHTVEELEMIWYNTAAYLKPGGLAIANRNNPKSQAAAHGKYGVRFTNFEAFPGGFSYHYNALTEPPLRFEPFAHDSYYKGSLDIPAKFFERFETVPWEETPVVKADSEFWKEYLEDPILYIFTARKRS